MARVIIGVDPHKRSATIEIINAREKTVGQGRFGTDRDSYLAMLSAGRKHKDRLWAVEGCNGIGRQSNARNLWMSVGRRTLPATLHVQGIE
ncbi:hypothetical protein [Micromonospora sp. NPDC023814]|uniref:hypothetical protein n=1 Tax=Micromonospora sp. NPDC023814 TaxID=3154596 RepID=UPI0033C5EBE5